MSDGDAVLGWYDGDLRDGKRHGHGTYHYPNSFFRYTGEWQDGQKHGNGIFFFGDGGMYEGMFQNGNITGNGTRRWTDGSIYMGEFLEGERHGRGVYLGKDGTKYEGEWHWNRYHGNGKLQLNRGALYVGSFFEHKFHGHGRLEEEDGSYYEGEFQNGLYDGEGELFLHPCNSLYIGAFSSGMRHGFGKYECHVSGIMVEGEWRCNRTYPTPSRLEWSVDDDSARDSLVRENPHFPGQFGIELASPGDVIPSLTLSLSSEDGLSCTSESGRRVSLRLIRLPEQFLGEVEPSSSKNKKGVEGAVHHVEWEISTIPESAVFLAETKLSFSSTDPESPPSKSTTFLQGCAVVKDVSICESAGDGLFGIVVESENADGEILVPIPPRIIRVFIQSKGKKK